MRNALLLAGTLAAIGAVTAEESRLPGIVAALRSEVDTGRAMDTMRQVWSTDRWFTFPKFEETAAYLAQRMKSAGLRDVEVSGAPANGKSQAGFWTMPMAWDVKEARLEMIAPEAMLLADYREVPTSVGMWCGPTPPEGVTAEVVELKGTSPDESVRGKLVLTDRNPADFKWLLVRHGALGAINAFTENPALEDGRQWINAWGDNGWAFTRGSTPLLSFSVTPKQAKRVRALLTSGKTVKVRAKVASRYYEGRYPYVTGVLPGSGSEEVLVLGHTSEQGAHDNATGVAAMVEALTALRRLVDLGKLPRPARSIRILTMPELYGSLHYITTHQERMRRTVAAMAVDTPAGPYEMKGTEYTFHMNPHVAASFTDALVLKVAEAQLARRRPWHVKEHTTGTDSYLGEPTVGVPTVWPYSGTGVHSHHNSEDRPETVDARSLKDLTVITAAYLYYIASAGEADARWLAGVMQSQALEEVRGARNKDEAFYRREVAERSIRSLSRLAPGLDNEPWIAKLGPRGDAPAVKKLGIVVRRKRPGTIPLDDLPKDQWAGYPSGAWDKTPTIALYWCDGKRDLAEVIRLTRMEVPSEKLDFAGYFRFLEKHGYVEILK